MAELSDDERAKVWGPVFGRLRDDADAHIMDAVAYLESPIEEQFLAALVMSDTPPNVILLAVDGSRIDLRRVSDPEELLVTPQAPVGPYRADFKLRLCSLFQNKESVVFVELDGHDFHEKTKEQAARDKRRDRYFATRGLTVLRFTGSEVFKNSAKCAAEALGWLSREIWAR